MRLDLRFTDKPRSRFGDGKNPAVAYNDDNVAIVMADQDGKVKYAAAKVDTTKDAPNPPFTFTSFAQANSSFPSVALNKAGVVLEVHQTGDGLFYRRGKLDGTTLTWAPRPTSLVPKGAKPSVSINNNGAIVVVFEQGTGLSYLTGTFNATTITFSDKPVPYQTTGTRPSVALTDGGEVVAVHANGRLLMQSAGILSGNQITWQATVVPAKTTYRSDSGLNAAVATNGKVAIQVLQSIEQPGQKLYGCASLLFDRSNWMSDNIGVFKDKTLRSIAFPGSHDAGAFAVNNGQTQDINIGSQLLDGVRYFDVRPKYSGDLKTIDASKITTYHDIDVDNTDYLGPALAAVVSDVRLFMQSHNELVILKISHFKGFNQQVFDALAKVIFGDEKKKTGLKKWLFPLNDDGTRLADRPLSAFLQPKRGTVLVVVDVDGPNVKAGDKFNDYITADYRKQGLYRYRDWYATDPAKGDLTVFDVFSETNNFETMSINDANGGYTLRTTGKTIPRGQLNKFLWFDGLCQKDDNDPSKPSKVQCDLFLLSWTLTPSIPSLNPLRRVPKGEPTAFAGAGRANGALAQYLAIPAYQSTNPQNLRMNVLYVDAVEFSRATDVALIRNGIGREPGG